MPLPTPNIKPVNYWFHGSATSSSSAFLTKAHPKISVIEVGARKKVIVILAESAEE